MPKNQLTKKEAAIILQYLKYQFPEMVNDTELSGSEAIDRLTEIIEGLEKLCS